MIEIFEFIRPWPVAWQVILLVVVATLATHVVVQGMRFFSKDFMSSFVVLFRGWPPKHITRLNDDLEDEPEDDLTPKI